MIIALGQQGGCLRFSFLCGVLYLAWVVPQLLALHADVVTPEMGLSWLGAMVVLCLAASLIGWWIGLRRGQPNRMPLFIPKDTEISRLFWPAAGLTAFVFLMHVLIGLQPLEAREQTQWSGPLTIIAFFLNLAVISLFISLRICLEQRNLRAFVLAGANILLSGTAAFVGVRRGEIIDFGIAGVAAMWFGPRKRIPIAVLFAGVAGMAVVTYAIGPLRTAANEIAERTGERVGLLSPEVWRRVDYSAEFGNALSLSPDFANATYLIDYSNKWGYYTFGQQSWDRLVFQWVPAQILGAGVKNGLMFGSFDDYGQIEAEYGYKTSGGSTTTGFGFAYQEFGLLGFAYFLLIGIVMGRLWSKADAGDIWAQILYVSFAGGALLSVTHHAMFLIVQMPLFLLAMFMLRWTVTRGVRKPGLERERKFAAR